jgi:hypothetical protein
MEAASGSAIPTKLCVLDEVTPAKGHRAQHSNAASKWRPSLPVRIASVASSCVLSISLVGGTPSPFPTEPEQRPSRNWVSSHRNGVANINQS